METATWGDVIRVSFENLWTGVIAFIPNFIAALVILILGWIIAALLGRVIAQIIHSLKVDEVLSKTGLQHALRKGGIELNAGNFLGSLIKWFVIVVFFVAAFDVLGLTQVNDFLKNVVLSYLPHVIIAVLVLLVAAVIADAMQRFVSASARTAGIHSANLLGNITKWAIWIFAVLAALIHLGIAPSLINTLFTGFVVALSLALGLSFGLGGQDAAARFIEKTREEISHH